MRVLKPPYSPAVEDRINRNTGDTTGIRRPQEIAFILVRKIMAQCVWLEDSGSSPTLPKVCLHRGAPYIQLGPTFHVGHGLRDACAHILVWQTHVVHSTLGM